VAAETLEEIEEEEKHAHDDDHGDGNSHDEEEHEEGEPWLVSYADMMTLLFGFFVLMYTFEVAKNAGVENVVKMRKEIATFFGGEYVAPLEFLAEEFRKAIKDKEISKELDIQVVPEGLEISVESRTVFERGSAKLTAEAQSVIETLADLLIKRGEIKNLVVEGHTDDLPVSKASPYKSNWTLSGARATGVVELFANKGFDPKKMYGVAFGESRPKAPNRDEKGRVIPKNQAKNRRIMIKVALDEKAATDVANQMIDVQNGEKPRPQKATGTSSTDRQDGVKELPTDSEPEKQPSVRPKESSPQVDATLPGEDVDNALQDALRDAENFETDAPRK
jgi:chemotaxis protein MotB